MNFMELMALGSSPYLQADDDEPFPLPDWARAEMWLGWWSRRFHVANARLLTVAVLPCRDLASAFAGLGCVIAGAQSFSGDLTWEKFTTLPPGTEIFWRLQQFSFSYEGVIVDATGWPSGMVPVNIVKSRRSSEVASVIGFSHNSFDEYIFSEVRLPGGQRMQAMEDSVRFQRALGVDASSRWSLSGKAECCLITNQAEFWRQLEGIRLGSESCGLIPFSNVLHAGKGTDNTASKLALSSAGHYSGHNVPVTILDGPAAFHQLLLVESGNVMVLLERSEYTTDVRNILLELRNVPEDAQATMLPRLPACLPPSMEVTAFIVPTWQ